MGVKEEEVYSPLFPSYNAADTKEVCQTVFLGTLDLSFKKVRTAVDKKRLSESGVCPEDRRGKHGHQPRISE